MERGILQNSAVNIYQHYFDDMIATDLVQPLGLRWASERWTVLKFHSAYTQPVDLTSKPVKIAAIF